MYNMYARELPQIHKEYFERDLQRIVNIRPWTPIFYGTCKLHKKNQSVCPIISSCGSLPEIFIIYIDDFLKRLVQEVIPTYIIISDHLVHALTKKSGGTLPHGAKLFSMHSVSMYENIYTHHGILVISKFICL